MNTTPPNPAGHPTSTPSPADRPSKTSLPLNPVWQRWLHLWALSSLAIAQPIYDRLNHQAVFLVEEGIRPITLYCLVGLLSAVIPGLLMTGWWLTQRFSQRVGQAAWQVLLGCLLLLLFTPVMMRLLFLDGWAQALLAVMLTGICLWGYPRWSQLRSLATCSSLGIVLFPVLFLWQSPSLKALESFQAMRGPNFRPLPIVMLIFDEFCGASIMTPDGKIDAGRFPNFAGLAQDSTWFPRATSVSPGTEFAVPAILSGRYPRTIVTTYKDTPQSLFQAISTLGEYELSLFEPVSIMAPTQLNERAKITRQLDYELKTLLPILFNVYLYHVIPDDFHTWLPEIPRIWFGLVRNHGLDQTQTRGLFRYSWGEQREQQFEHFLKGFQEGEQPTLHFQHILLPHVPWSYFPDGRRYQPDDDNWRMLFLEGKFDEGGWPDDEWLVIQHQQRYLLQLQYLDGQLGRLIAKLKETGLYDQSLLIVTADHGVSFRSGAPRRNLTNKNLDEIVNIPLFIKRPGQTARVIDERPVESVDIFPTIMAELGVVLQQPTDGWSLFDTTQKDRSYQSIFVGPNLIRIDPQRIRATTTPIEIQRRFGESSDPESLFQIGPRTDWIGRKLTEYKLQTTSPYTLQMTEYRTELSDQPEALVPGYYTGVVQSELAQGQTVELILSVNGIVRGSTRTFRGSVYDSQFQFLISPSAFQRGHNDVQIHAVMAGDTPELIPCQLKMPPPPKPKAKPSFRVR